MFSNQSKHRSIITVTKLNRLARSILESEIGEVWVSAEISNFVAASSGHWYFTLKDKQAQVKAAMFKGANRNVSFKPKEGDKVLVKANISLYEARGDYQLIAQHIEPEGEGQLKQAFEALKHKLFTQGFFDAQHKKTLPNQVTNVGVITSATGAALHDILHVLQRRNPCINVILYPCQVQGAGSAERIVNALRKANQRNEVDILIVGRGGGSLEDLWSFNEEIVAMAIYESTLPVVSAVGHEVDVTIADFVADVRAPTPSAAAEIISTDTTVLVTGIVDLQARLVKSVLALLQHKRYAQQLLLQQLNQNHPKQRIQQQIQFLDRIELDLIRATTSRLTAKQEKLKYVKQQLAFRNPQKQITHLQHTLADTKDKLCQQARHNIQRAHSDLNSMVERLNTVSPLATFSRGYTATFKENTAVKRVSDLSINDTITTRLHDGKIISVISDIDADAP